MSTSGIEYHQALTYPAGSSASRQRLNSGTLRTQAGGSIGRVAASMPFMMRTPALSSLRARCSSTGRVFIDQLIMGSSSRSGLQLAPAAADVVLLGGALASTRTAYPAS